MIHDQTCLRFFPFFSPTLFPFRQDSQMKLRLYTRLCIFFTEYSFGNDAARYPSLSLLFPVSHAMSASRCCGKSFFPPIHWFHNGHKGKGCCCPCNAARLVAVHWVFSSLRSQVQQEFISDAFQRFENSKQWVVLSSFSSPVSMSYTENTGKYKNKAEYSP